MQVIRKIDIKLAAITMIVLLVCAVLFHLLVLSGVIPFNIVWGGRLENMTQMYVMETVSLAINFAVIVIVSIKGGYIRPYMPKKIVTFLLWVLVALFAFNTAGNLFAENRLEMVLFTPLTLISTILFYRMAIEH